MSSAAPLTTVVMVSYHTGPILFEAIKAVLASAEPVQLCLVDNGNPPAVLAQLQQMAAANPHLLLLTGHGNIGFGRGCNLGARAATSRYILILNPDSLLPDDAITRLLKYAATLMQPFMIGARLQNRDGSEQRGCRRALLTPKMALIEALHLQRIFPSACLNLTDEPMPASLSPIPAISGAFMFLPEDDYWRIGGFDEDYFLHFEDLDFCLRFCRAGGQTYFAPDVAVTHIGGTSDATNVMIEKHKARSFMRYLQQNYHDDVPRPVLWLLGLMVWVRVGLKAIMR